MFKSQNCYAKKSGLGLIITNIILSELETLELKAAADGRILFLDELSIVPR